LQLACGIATEESWVDSVSAEGAAMWTRGCRRQHGDLEEALIRNAIVAGQFRDARARREAPTLTRARFVGRDVACVGMARLDARGVVVARRVRSPNRFRPRRRPRRSHRRIRDCCGVMRLLRYWKNSLVSAELMAA
jgi:hypothetical protein